MQVKKEICFGIIFKFTSFKQLINQKEFFLKMIARSFKKFYFINCQNLEFPKIKSTYNLKEYQKLISKKFIIFDPRNIQEFENFCENKKLILFADIGTEFPDFRVHYLLKKTGCKLVFASNIGNFQGTEYHKPSSFIKQVFIKKLPKKIIVILSILGIFPKIQIRYVTNKKILSKIKKSFLFRISQKYPSIGLTYNKKYELVNSLAHDTFALQKFNLNEKKIVMIDTNIFHPDNNRFAGRISKKNAIKIYVDLGNFLKKFSKIYKKPVVICVHPSSNIRMIKKILKDFEVIKFETKKKIYQSFVTFFYESSAIVDAFYLNKRVVALENTLLGGGWVRQINQYPFKTGIMKININNEVIIKDKDYFLKKIDATKKTNKYKNFVRNNLKPDGNNLGTIKIINSLKNNFLINS